MARITKSLLLASTLPAIALSAGLALAQDAGRMIEHGGMMGGDGRGGMMSGKGRGGMMGPGMEGCMQMMRGMHRGGGQRPNEQWRPR